MYDSVCFQYNQLFVIFLFLHAFWFFPDLAGLSLPFFHILYDHGTFFYYSTQSV